VGVSLVTDIPNDLVERSIIDIVQCDSKLNRAKARPQVAGIYLHHLNDELPDLLT
jgi:hypothetical protein